MKMIKTGSIVYDQYYNRTCVLYINEDNIVFLHGFNMMYRGCYSKEKYLYYISIGSVKVICE